MKALSSIARKVAVGVFGASIFGGLVVLGSLNPTVVVAPAPRTPSELLADPSFGVPINGPWQPTSSASTFGPLLLKGESRRLAVVSGTVRQDVALTPVNGRSYRFSVQVGSTSFARSTVHLRGLLRLQTACASGEERAETLFDVELVSKDGAAQTAEAAVTLTPKASKDCSMRVEIVSDGGDQLLVERASLVDALLDDPSFESGAPQWKLTKGITKGTDGATFTTQPFPDASDGGAVGVLKAGATSVSIIQDLPLDLSSEAVLGTFTIDARSASSTPVEIALRAYEPCGPKITEFKTTLRNIWTAVGVQQQRVSGTNGELPPDPKDLIRPFGPACIFRVEVVVLTPGATVQLDSALLDLRTYNPPQGSPRYRASIKDFIDVETEASRRLAQDEAVRQAQSPAARRNP